MDFAPVYLAQRFFYRIWEFFYHWYVDGSRAIGNKFKLSAAAVRGTFVGGIAYFLIAVAFAVVYVVWLAIPPALLWYAATGII